MTPFEVVQAIQSAGVGVVGLDLRRTVVILRSVDDQNVGETVVIRFWCISQRIKKCGRSHEGKVKRHLMTSATVTRVRIDDERAGPPSSPIQTYKQSWISTATATTDTTATISGGGGGGGSGDGGGGDGGRELFRGLFRYRVLRR